MMKEDLDQVERSLLRAPRRAVPEDDLLSTGSTVLDLSLTGSAGGGFAAGGYYFLVGDSSSGKTFCAATCLAEACRNPRFKKHRLVYIDKEDGAKMLRTHFGQDLNDRLEVWSARDKVKAPDTTEEMYDRLDELFKKPAIAVVDSDNAIPCQAELDLVESARSVRKGGKKATPGSMGMDKPKLHSSRLRLVTTALPGTGSILIFISQTRDRIGPGALYNPRTRSGGNALTFYATSEIWTSVAGSLKKTYRGREAANGIIVRAKVKKSRLSGRVRTVFIPLYWDTGLDDLGGCVDFLTYWKHWPVSDKGVIEAGEFDLKARRDALVEEIQDGGSEEELRALTARVWREVEQALSVNRKSRYV